MPQLQITFEFLYQCAGYKTECHSSAKVSGCKGSKVVLTLTDLSRTSTECSKEYISHHSVEVALASSIRPGTPFPNFCFFLIIFKWASQETHFKSYLEKLYLHSVCLIERYSQKTCSFAHTNFLQGLIACRNWWSFVSKSESSFSFTIPWSLARTGCTMFASRFSPMTNNQAGNKPSKRYYAHVSIGIQAAD